MKNKKLFKTLLFILLIVIAFTWVIPGTITNDQTGVLELGVLKPEGLMGIFGSFDIVAQYFFQNMLIILMVGMFYGVINKTGAYKELVEKIASKLKKKKELFLIVTIVFFILLTALTNMYFLLFLFVPFFMNVLNEMGYNKNIMLLSTVGSILIGFSTQLTNSMFVKTINSTTNPYIWIKVGVLVLFTVLTVLYALKCKEGKEKDKEEAVLELEKRKAKKVNTNPKALQIVLIIVFVLFLLGFVPWNFTFFQKMNEAIMGVKIGQFQIFANIFGRFNAFGAWWTGELYTMLSAAAILIALLYKLSFDEFVDGLLDGLKKFMVPAFLVGLMTLITIFTINSGFIGTILKFIVSSGNAALLALGNIIGAPVIADPYYISNYTIPLVLSAVSQPNAELVAFISQITYGITMLLVPTSAIMVAGLSYLEKDYKGWLKFIWKLAVVLVGLSFVAIVISTLIK